MGSPENQERWGLPNWQDAPPYRDDTKKWSDDRWRWEFTRRRQDYRTDFNSARSSNRTLTESLRNDEPSLIVGSDDANETSVMPSLARKYGFCVPRLLNPEFSVHQSHDIVFDDHSLRIYYFGPNISDRIPVPKGSMAVVLDLSKPWGKSQRGKIEASFKECQKNWNERTGSAVAGKRAHQKTWPGYLRILDARECGASWNDIAVAGAADDASSAQKAWKAAKHLMFNWPTSANS